MSDPKSKELSSNSSGVQELINRLKDEGVAAGREESERIIRDAEKRAEWLLKQAHEEADELVNNAKKQAQFIEEAGRDALSIAVRDSQLYLKNQLTEAFSAQINQVVKHQVADPDLLQQMILAIASQSRPENKEIMLLLGESDAQSACTALDEESTEILKQFVSTHTNELLEKGVKVHISESPTTAIQIKICDENTIIDLSSESISQLIIMHVQPHFKSMLEGLLN